MRRPEVTFESLVAELGPERERAERQAIADAALRVADLRAGGVVGMEFPHAEADCGTVTLHDGCGGTLRLVCDVTADARQLAAAARLGRLVLAAALPGVAGRWPLLVFTSAHWTLYVPVRAVLLAAEG